ncbi:MAG: DUF2282 domain-containing protein [Rhodospirillales bacterium]|nr:DUF2282 domain-containing protein [Rhodospirillales bacterium]
MNRRTLAASIVAAAMTAGVASVASAAPMMTQAQMMKVQQANHARAMAQHLVACYGVAAAGKNDCAAGAHSCAGQSTISRDPKSFVLLPAGDCQKIAGGSLTAG